MRFGGVPLTELVFEEGDLLLELFVLLSEVT
jgi:hypothetical protein